MKGLFVINPNTQARKVKMLRNLPAAQWPVIFILEIALLPPLIKAKIQEVNYSNSIRSPIRC